MSEPEVQEPEVQEKRGPGRPPKPKTVNVVGIHPTGCFWSGGRIDRGQTVEIPEDEEAPMREKMLVVMEGSPEHEGLKKQIAEEEAAAERARLKAHISTA